jgi:hypothetical protein
MKTILVLAHQDDGLAARLQVALDLTRTVGGHLSCIDAVAPGLALAHGDHGDGATAEPASEEYPPHAAHEARVKAWLGKEGVAWNWIDASGFLGASLKVTSDLVDVVVVSIGFGANEPPVLRKLARYLETRQSRPIFAVPKDAICLDPGGTALVAYDGACPPDEALRDVLPLLELSRDVILLDIGRTGDEPVDGHLVPSPAARYLSQHGIPATVELSEPVLAQPDCTAIRVKAHEVDAAYIVMGAFGHSPDISAIAGSLLANSDLPLFLPHR